MKAYATMKKTIAVILFATIFMSVKAQDFRKFKADVGPDFSAKAGFSFSVGKRK